MLICFESKKDQWKLQAFILISFWNIHVQTSDLCEKKAWKWNFILSSKYGYM